MENILIKNGLTHYGFHATEEAAIEMAHILAAFEHACRFDDDEASHVLRVYARGDICEMETLTELYSIAGIKFPKKEY